MYGLDREFPHLSNTNHQLTSPRTEDYNCIAWAANDEERWWWPIGEVGGVEAYWPSGVNRSLTVDSFVEAFATLGYAISIDGELVSGIEKVALYVDQANVPTHMAKQLSNGQWSSKLGQWNDISHVSLDIIEGPAYGTVAVYLERPRQD